MELSQTVLPDLFARQRIQVGDDKVIIDYKNLMKEIRLEFSYEELAPKVGRARMADAEWSSIGWGLVAIVLLGWLLIDSLFPGAFTYPANRMVLVGMGALALSILAMRFIIKYDQVWFYTRNNDFAFALKLYRHDRAARERIVDFILQKTVSAHTSTIN
jgi:hypothetical protein